MKLIIITVLLLLFTGVVFYQATKRFPLPIFLEHKNNQIIHPVLGSYPEMVHDRPGLLRLPGQRVIKDQ